MYQRKIAYLFSYRNGVRVRSTGILRRYGEEEMPVVTLELFGEDEKKKNWHIYYFDRRDILSEASFYWETISGCRSEVRTRCCHLCAEAGNGGGVLMLPEQAVKEQSEWFGGAEADEYLCARFDGAEITRQQIQQAFSMQKREAYREREYITSAKKLVEEITKAAGGETDVTVQKPQKTEDAVPLRKKAEQNRIACLEELLVSRPSYNPCRKECVLYSVRVLPEELSLLPGERRRFAENSFLLHGYYRYRHLLLGRRRGREKEEYILLVPGRYHNAEVRLACLFGFTEFFPATQTAVSGKGMFGYWCAKM